MAVARYNHTATLLPDGRCWSRAGRVRAVRWTRPRSTTWQTNVLLGRLADDREDGPRGGPAPGRADAARWRSRGEPARDPTYLASAEIYDQAAGGFHATGSMAQARYSASSALLKDGRVLVFGGLRLGDEKAKYSLASAEIYDPAAGAFAAPGRCPARVWAVPRRCWATAVS